jgi:serine phosphatase RsbU (regulator of sigma subunit)
MLVLVFSGIFLKLLFNSIEGLFPLNTLEYDKTLNIELLPLVFIFSASTILLSVASLVIFRHLFFLKQSKNLNIYFNAMLIFIALASFTSFTGTKKYENYEFLEITFYVVTSILIFMNSLKISWIAFLKKKQKRQLLLISVLLIGMLIFYLTMTTGESSYHKLLSGFSQTFYRFNNIMTVYGIIYFSVLFFTTLFHLPTAEAFDRRTKEISSLQYFSKLINQVFDPKELSDTISELGTDVSGADASWLILFGGNNKVEGIRGTGFVTSEKITNFIRKKQDLTTVKKIVMGDLKEFYRNEITDEQYALVYLVPMVSYSKCHGILVLLKKDAIEYDDEEKNIIQTFADYASVAIENSYLLKESIEKERLEKEFDVAREMQQKILPEKLPEFKNYEVAAVFIPAFEVGGDYYDFFSLPNGITGFVIADVSGKGISAAFVMAELKGILESFSTVKWSPKEILVEANYVLRKVLDRRVFITAVFGVFDPETGEVTIARAGHCPVLHHTAGGIIERVPAGFGLGMNFTELFRDNLVEEKFTLNEDESLVLFTDGVNEMKNELMKDFGTERLKSIVLNNVELSMNELAGKIINDLTEFAGTKPQHDDITLMILKRNKPEKNNGRI